MIQFTSKLVTVDDFITHYADSDRYELIDGELVEIEPTITVCILQGDEYQKQLF
ncbi:MAG: hypothetical protein KME23_21245 [Goleter apudmare HA4340-LM2]|jgi:hypothetical protein|nr:hypothetical protein [Goleter apudmare HA4340-LM2]